MKFRYPFLFFIQLTIGVNLSAQNCEYYKLLQQAKKDVKASNFTWALQSYEEALEYSDLPSSAHLWAISNLYVDNKEYDKATIRIKQLIALGVSIESLESKYWVNDDFMASEHWKTIKAEYSGLRSQFYVSMDVDFIISITELGTKLSAVWGARADSVAPEKIQAFHNRLVNQCMSDLRALIHKHGFPNEYNVGVDANSSFMRIVRWGISNGYHDDIEWKYFDHQIRQQVKEGFISPYLYCAFSDRYHVNAFGYQLYGTYYDSNGFSAFNQVDSINSRRANYCLEPIEEFAKQNDLVWPPKN
jgi:hypothetical protein